MWKVFQLKFLFVPFARRNIVIPGDRSGGFLGYSEYFIFGFRIAKLQRTMPWEDV